MFTRLAALGNKTDICRDEKDNMILDTAVSGKAEYIITGDKDLLSIGKHERISIVTPSEFLKQFNRLK